MQNLLASAYPTCMKYYLTTQVFTSKLNYKWCTCTYLYNSCICTYIRTYCFQLLLCWSFLPTTLNYLQVSPSSPCVGSSLRNGVQVVRDTFEARQETEEDHTSLQEQTVSDTHHIHPTLHHHSTIQSRSYLTLFVVVWHETCVQTHTVWGSWSCK